MELKANSNIDSTTPTTVQSYCDLGLSREAYNRNAAPAPQEPLPLSPSRHDSGGIKDLGNYSCRVKGCERSTASAKRCRAYKRGERAHRPRVTTVLKV